MRSHTVCFAMASLLGIVQNIAFTQEADTKAAGTKRVETGKPFAQADKGPGPFKGVKKLSEYVRMSDGQQLAADVYLPSDGPAQTAFPVIFLYTPYQRSTIDPKTGQVKDLTKDQRSLFFLSHGYALVYADMRGTGASTGWLMDFMPRIADDGKEVVDWMAKQPWCDGNVGMFGGSYVGWSQTATASRIPKALKCIMPSVIPLEGFTGEVYPGGIFLQGFLKMWSGHMYGALRNQYKPKAGWRPTTPVVDEDGDGELADEIPLDANKNGSFLDDGFPPTYSDGQKRKHVYYRATKDHEKDLDYAAWAATQFFLDAKSPLGMTLYDLGPNGHVPGLIQSGIPIYHVGGWFDGFTRGSFELYCTLKKTNPSKLAMPPSYHGFTSGPFWRHFGHEIEDVGKGILGEHLRFYDRYLKGIKNGIDTEPPLSIYVMNGQGWRFENEWPLARQVMTKLHFNSANKLTRAKSKKGADPYKADFTHNSSYGKNQGNRLMSLGGRAPNALPIRTEKDEQCLCYTSDAMDKDTEVTGHPVVHLWVSSTARHGDFFVYLEDVDAKGQAILVTDGLLRAGFAALHDNDTIIARGVHKIDVLPDLPWHGFEKKQYVDGILAGGKAVELVIDFNPTAWVFKAGHRIRVSIACADYPTFRLHPKLSAANKPGDPGNIVPTIRVHRGGSHSSYVELPVIPE